MSVSTTSVTKTYDAESNIIQTVGASQGAAENLVDSPVSQVPSISPIVDSQGVSNQPLNAKSVPTQTFIGASTGNILASWANPA